MTPKVEAAQAQARRVTALLRISGAPADTESADSLERDLAAMEGRYAAKEALFRIGQRCHPKALPDRVIPGMTVAAWSHEIEILEGLCAEAFAELEQSAP